MSVDTLNADLATLREALAIAWPEGDHAEPHVFSEALAALGRVEAELSRLREQRDAAEKRASDSHEVMIRVYARAEAAEAELRECRDSFTEVERVAMRVVAAEARCARLQHGVRELYCEVDCRVEHGAESGGHLDFVRRELRALMDTPADNQEDKT